MALLHLQHLHNAATMVLVPKKERKKNSSKTQFCLDFRKLNAATQTDAYPVPNIQDILEQQAGSTTIDLNSDYWQVPVDKDSQVH